MREESVVRILCSRCGVLFAFGLMSVCLCGLSGCDSKPADGMLAEPPHLNAEEKAEVQSQYKKRRLDVKDSKSSKKGKTARNNP